VCLNFLLNLVILVQWQKGGDCRIYFAEFNEFWSSTLCCALLCFEFQVCCALLCFEFQPTATSESFVPTRIRGTKPIFSCRAIPGTAGFSPWSPDAGFRGLDEMMLPSPSPHGILSPVCSEPLSLNGYSLNQGAREAPQAFPRTEFISGGLFTLWFAYDWHFRGSFCVKFLPSSIFSPQCEPAQ
jgi:hypothetical protein